MCKVRDYLLIHNISFNVLLRNGVAYLDGDVISSEDGGCTSTREVCSIEDDVAIVVKTINNTCCSGSGAVEAKVQWYNYMHSEAGTFLDVSADGQPTLAQASQNSDSQKWRLVEGQLKNKGYPGKNLGVQTDGKLALVEDTLGIALSSLAFENGRFVDTSSSYGLMIAADGSISWSHNIVKRQTNLLDSIVGALEELLAGPVECSELGLPSVQFEPFQENPINTQCWDANQPTFRLYMGGKSNREVYTADRKEHLISIPQPFWTLKKITKLVVVIHGFTADAEPGSWSEELAELALDNDDTVTAALTVDWSDGAGAIDLGFNWNLATSAGIDRCRFPLNNFKF